VARVGNWLHDVSALLLRVVSHQGTVFDRRFIIDLYYGAEEPFAPAVAKFERVDHSSALLMDLSIPQGREVSEARVLLSSDDKPPQCQIKEKDSTWLAMNKDLVVTLGWRDDGEPITLSVKQSTPWPAEHLVEWTFNMPPAVARPALSIFCVLYPPRNAPTFTTRSVAIEASYKMLDGYRNPDSGDRSKHLHIDGDTQCENCQRDLLLDYYVFSLEPEFRLSGEALSTGPTASGAVGFAPLRSSCPGAMKILPPCAMAYCSRSARS